MRPNRKKWPIVAAAFAAVATFIVLSGRDEPPAAPIAAQPELFPFVRSLQGTYPDGEPKVDDTQGMLVADAGLRRLFDYYLSAIGEKSVEQIRAEIERELEQRLQQPALAQAKQLLARYLDYKRELVEVERNPQALGSGLPALRHRLAAMHEVRSRFFSAAESEAMFGFDDAYDTDALARLEISQDPALSEQQKRDKLAELDAALPAALREARDAPLQIVRLEQAAQKMRADGASDDEVYRMRAAALSPEAAARMAEVDQQEAGWKNRIDAYLAERRQLQQNSGNLPTSEQQALLEQLRQTHFRGDELKRLPAYE